jgi:hypothetical protein
MGIVAEQVHLSGNRRCCWDLQSHQRVYSYGYLGHSSHLYVAISWLYWNDSDVDGPVIAYCSVLAYAVYRHRQIAMEESDEHFEKVFVDLKANHPGSLTPGFRPYSASLNRPDSLTPGFRPYSTGPYRPMRPSPTPSVRSPRQKPNLTITIPPAAMSQTSCATSTVVTPFGPTPKSQATKHPYTPTVSSPLRTSRSSSARSSLVYGGIVKTVKTPSMPAAPAGYRPPQDIANRTPTPRRATFPTPRQPRQPPPWY